jgi:hypothetical protein
MEQSRCPTFGVEPLGASDTIEMAVLSVSRCVLSLSHQTAWVRYLVLLSNFLGARLMGIELLMFDLGLLDVRLIRVSVSLYAYIIKPDGRTNVEAAGFHYICMYKHNPSTCYVYVSVSLYAYIIKPDGRTNVEAAGFHYICTYKHTIYSIYRTVCSVLSVLFCLSCRCVLSLSHRTACVLSLGHRTAWV